MGLDMYLYARKYVTKFDYTNFNRDMANMPPINKEWETLAALPPKGLMDNAQDFGGISVSYPVGYWRKAHAIHDWFVNELAHGVDECQEISVSRVDLEILRNSCKAILSSDEMEEEAAEQNLDSIPGLDGNKIDEWYIESLKDTVAMIDNVLSIIQNDSPDYWQFIYQASW